MKKFVLALTCAVALSGLAAEREAMSPFDDAAYWFRGGVDLDGNGIIDSGSKEAVNVLKAGVPDDASHVWKLASGKFGTMDAKVGKVAMPYANRILDNAPYVHLNQPAITNNWITWTNGVEYPVIKVQADYISPPGAAIFANVPAGQKLTQYSVFLRFRQEEPVSVKQLENVLFQCGFNYSNGDGFSFSIAKNDTGGRSPKVYLGQQQVSIWNHDFTYGRWNDLCVTVDGNKLRIFSVTAKTDVDAAAKTNRLFATSELTCNGGKTSDGKNVNDIAIMSNRHHFSFGGEGTGDSLVFTNGVNGTSGNQVKAFRGDIQTFAFWTRVLSTNEIRQVFSERRPALVTMGVANGNSDEFTKEEQETDGMGTHPEKWNPVLNAAHPSASVKFTIVNGEQDVPQYVHLRPIVGSAQATVAFSIDGHHLITQTLADDEDAFVFIKAAYLTTGTHTLTLTRTDANEGDFAVDALKVHGSWRIGTGGTHGGMNAENETYVYKNPRIYHLTDGNLLHFARGFTGGDNSTHYYPFDIPAGLVGKMRDATFFFNISQVDGTTGGGTMTFDVSVNGETIASGLTGKAKAYTVTVKADKLKAGANEIIIKRTAGANWGNCGQIQLSLGRLISGAMMILK